ncbi:hypothetical protein CHLRE_12g545704v5 [Chlamydomonas reinhardtii]|uniref:Uncharacterized protein n=1 Tax=Chlamydomonas reinhardtii TaxID=3055 RepID=A0A2K3D6K2_CHLRE|nr:uncharacterized protein CHLRE_12g545704v5 [Chlamydomonas reinhardtii]PNW76154.1 hypothetical protein CHLRE_12g545704v5 [Chlamydomonas reinhardtii]
MVLCNAPGARTALAAAERYVVYYASLGDDSSPKLGGDATTTTPAPLRIRPPAPAPAQHPRAATLASSKLAAPTQVPASASPPGQAARNIVPAQAAPSRVKQPTQPGSGGKAATKDDEAAPTGTSDSPATTTTDPAATHDGSVKVQGWIARGLTAVSGWCIRVPPTCPASLTAPFPCARRLSSTGKRKNYRPPSVERQVGSRGGVGPAGAAADPKSTPAGPEPWRLAVTRV